MKHEEVKLLSEKEIIKRLKDTPYGYLKYLETHTSISSTYLSRIRSGKQKPGLRILLKLSTFFGKV